MHSRRFSLGLLITAIVVCLTCIPLVASAQQPGELTIDRIYGQSSLSGHPTRGIAWSPDGKRLTFLDANGTGKDAKTVLWSLDSATGERTVLIPADKLESIFDRFYSERPQTETFGSHSGLGLSISRQIIEAHQGRISAENRRDDEGNIVGARFVIRLPKAGE